MGQTSTEKLEELRKLIEEGATWRAAGRSVGLSGSAAWRRATARWPELAGRRPRLSPEKKAAIRKAIMDAAGSYRAIARRFEVSPDTVSRFSRAMIESECEDAGDFKPVTVRTYRCESCGAMTTTTPCLPCMLRKRS